MPYIKPTQRDRLLVGEYPSANAGELNYKLTELIMEYLNTNGKDYQHINDILGALEGAKLEFYRRVVVPYEEIKREENGDVY